MLAAVLAIPRVKRLLSSDHFSVDGTLIEARASTKSFTRKDKAGDDGEPPASDPPAGRRAGRNGEVDFHGERRSNATHARTTDPDARLYRKGGGREAKLSYLGHVLMENRNGLVVAACGTQADGHAERLAALTMLEGHADRPSRITVGADKAFDTEDVVNEALAMNVTPHVAQNDSGRRSAIGWGKEAGCMRAPGSAACPASACRSPSRPPPAISCACRSCLPHDHDKDNRRHAAPHRDGRLR